jgi:hypothetical protein
MFGKKAKPKPANGGIEIVIPAAMPAGCAAGVIMPDGTIVRCEGEPPIAKGKNWFRKE